MKIYYTNKLIFWNNESSDFLEKEKFDEYLNDAWIELSNVKSINWDTHYSANFYASDSFEATYFKVEKNGQVYYFFIDDITFDGANGRQFSLSLDLYNTYSFQLIEKLKQENPNVYFTRKHMNRYFKISNKRCVNYIEQPYLFNVPKYFNDIDSSLYPSKSYKMTCIPNSAGAITWLKDEHGQFDDRPYRLGNGVYLYLRLKLSSKVNSIFPLSPIVYYPIRNYPSVEEKVNSYNKAIKYPADYVIDLCLLPIPPSSFDYGALVKEFYTGSTFDNDDSVILFSTLHGDTNASNLEESIKLIDIKQDEYNINYIDNEIALYGQPFKMFKILDNVISLPYYFSSFTNNGYAFLDDFLMSSIAYSAFGSFYLKIYNKITDNMYQPLTFITGDVKIPIIGDVYSNYLQNNGTSMQTQISLANEQKSINDSNTMANLGAGIFTGLLNIGLGGIAAIGSGGAFGLDAIGGGVSDLIGGGINAAYELKMNEFNLKKTIAQQDALKADLKNQVGDMKDVYGKGQLMNYWSAHLYDLPFNEKKRVFADFYFNGYIVNTIYKFNTYDNRINFNYFELKNVFALCSQYLKLPKSIMSSIAKQLESGIRLWKTPNFDYTLTLDNKENNYAIM